MADEEVTPKFRILKRAEAKALGLKRYFRGTPCKNGHIAERFTSDAHCVVCTDQKFWRWYGKNSASVVARGAKWRVDNPTLARQQRIRELPANRARVRKWAIDNPERAAANASASGHAHRARKRNATGKWTAAQIEELKRKQKGRCAFCLRSIAKKFHRDHKVSLARGGSNDIRNIQLLCPSCNQRKGTKDQIAFAQENGRLL